MAQAKELTDLDPKASTEQNARHIARIRLNEIYGWSAVVDKPYEVHGLHNLRIAAKRLRYTLEIFEEVLPVACQAVREELTQIQDELGTLHDSDVMIALLRLCLGGEDAGVAYEVALVEAGKHKRKGKLLLNPALVASVLDPEVAPSAEERYGLELLLRRQLQHREEQYRAFRKHWFQLQARDFRREILEALGV